MISRRGSCRRGAASAGTTMTRSPGLTPSSRYARVRGAINCANVWTPSCLWRSTCRMVVRFRSACDKSALRSSSNRQSRWSSTVLPPWDSSRRRSNRRMTSGPVERRRQSVTASDSPRYCGSRERQGRTALSSDTLTKCRRSRGCCSEPNVDAVWVVTTVERCRRSLARSRDRQWPTGVVTTLRNAVGVFAAVAGGEDPTCRVSDSAAAALGRYQPAAVRRPTNRHRASHGREACRA